MKNISKRTLSLITLLIIPGILMTPYFDDSIFIFIPLIMCLIGGMAFGSLLNKTL